MYTRGCVKLNLAAGRARRRDSRNLLHRNTQFRVDKANKTTMKLYVENFWCKNYRCGLSSPSSSSRPRGRSPQQQYDSRRAPITPVMYDDSIMLLGNVLCKRGLRHTWKRELWKNIAGFKRKWDWSSFPKGYLITWAWWIIFLQIQNSSNVSQLSLP